MTRMKMPSLVLALFFYILIILITQTFTMCSQSSDKDNTKTNRPINQIQVKKDSLQTSISPSDVKKIVESLASQVLVALKINDMAKLASLVHPDKGVRFSPYAYVDVKNDLVFTSSQIKTILTDTTKYLWGYYDGSGDDIKVTFAKYLTQFIYDRDFVNAKEIGYQKIIGRGNTINNSYEVYPNAIIIEYHFPGFDPKYKGMDWESLRLVFEQKSNIWYLVGIIHDQWTI